MQAEQANGFASRVAELISHVRYFRAITAAEIDPLIRLRYEAYLHEGAVAIDPKGELRDKFDDLPNAYNFGLFIDNRLASALRLHFLSGPEDYSPARETFPDMLEPMLDRGVTIVDPNRFVADYRVGRNYPELPYLTLRLAFMAARHFRADIVTATVRAEHQAFYRRVLRCKPLCPPRPYPMLTKPISLMAVSFADESGNVLRRYPFFESTPAERGHLFRSAMELTGASV